MEGVPSSEVSNNNDLLIKSKTYVPPRIDDTYYQVKVPGMISHREVVDAKEFQVFTSSIGEEKYSDYMIKMRNFFNKTTLYDESWWKKENISHPLENDAILLEFYHKFSYDFDKVSFLFNNFLNNGKDEMSNDRVIGNVDKLSTSILFSDYIDKVKYDQEKNLFASYHSDCDVVKLLKNYKSNRKLDWNSETNGLDTNSNLARSSRLSPQEKSEARLKWKALIEKVSRATNRNSTVLNLTFSEATKLLDEALSISIPLNQATSTAGSSAQALEDQLMIDNARSLFGEFIKKLNNTKYWITSIRDTIFRKSVNCMIVDPVSRVDSMKITELESLIQTGKKLDISVKQEEGYLMEYIQSAQISMNLIQTVISKLSASPLISCQWSKKILDKFNQEYKDCFASPLNIYTPREIENLLIPQKNDKLSRRLSSPFFEMTLEELYSTQFYEEPSFITMDIFRRNHILDSSKPKLDDVEKILNSFKYNPIKVTENIFLKESFFVASQLNRLCIELIGKLDLRKQKKSSIINFSWSKVLSLVEFLVKYPIELPDFNNLFLRLKAIYEWKIEVQSLKQNSQEMSNNQETQNSSSNGRNRRPSSTKEKSNKSNSNEKDKAVSMKKIDAMIAEGESFPFVFEEEFQILKLKKDQAKHWLDKFKKCFLPSQKNTRQTNNTTGVEPPQKLNLNDIKMMIDEGEQLFLNNEQDANTEDATRSRVGKGGVHRDIEKAHSLVETAEDWIERVHEVIANLVDDAQFTPGLATDLEDGLEVEGEENLNRLINDDKLLEPFEEINESSPQNLPETSSPEDFEETLYTKRLELIEVLNSFLQEAETMPVTLDEADFLRYQLQAIEWALKVRPMLVENKFITPLKAKDNLSPSPSNSGFATRMRYSEVIALKSEILKIRQGATAFSSVFSLQELEEEKIWLELAEKGEKLQNKIKKSLNGKEVKSASHFENLCSLLKESESLPINLDNELRPIQFSVKEIVEWMINNKNLLKTLNIWSSEIIPESFLTYSKSSLLLPNLTEVYQEDQQMNIESESERKISNFSLSDIEFLLHSANQLSASFPAKNSLKRKIDSCFKWLREVNSVKSKLFLFVNELLNTNQATNLHEFPLVTELPLVAKQLKKSSLPTQNNKKKGNNTEKIIKDELDASLDDNYETVDANPEDYESFDLSIQDIQDLIEEGENFSIDFSDEIYVLTTSKQILDQWEGEVISYLNDSFGEIFKIFNTFLSSHLSTSLAHNFFPFLLPFPNDQVSSDQSDLRRFQMLWSKFLVFERESLHIKGGVLVQKYLEAFKNLFDDIQNAFNSLMGVSNQEIVALVSSKPSFKSENIRWADVDPKLLLQNLSKLSGYLTVFSCQKWTSKTCPFKALTLCWQDQLDNMDEQQENTTDSMQIDSTELKNDNNEMVEDDAGDEQESNNESFSGKRKARESLDADAPAQKITRASVGIVKRKADDDFEDSSKMIISKGEATSNKKKSRNSNKFSANSISSWNTLRLSSPEVDEDWFKEVYDTFQDFFSSPQFSTFQFSEDLKFLLSCLQYSLQGYLERLNESNLWKSTLQKLLLNLGKTSSSYQQFQQHLLDAETRQILCQERIQLEERLDFSQKWLNKANNILQKNKKEYLTLDALKDFLKESEKVLLEHSSQLNQLKNELKKARTWKNSFDDCCNLPTGEEKTTLLNELVKESEELLVDVNESIDSIIAASRKYCLCRQLYFGEMIGCDKCDDWFHLQCVGLSAGQAEKVEKYNCIRCSLLQSFDACVQSLVTIIKKWLANEHFRSRDQLISKIRKKIYKETDELKRNKDLIQPVLPVPSSQPLAPTSPETLTDPSISNNLPLTSTETIPTSSSSTQPVILSAMDINQQNIDRLNLEFDRLKQQKEYELKHFRQILNWLKNVQQLIYCEGGDIRLKALGSPLSPYRIVDLNFEEREELLNPDSNTTLSYTDQTTNIWANLNILLPPGILILGHQAITHEIIQVEDVQSIIDHFKWLSWCNLALHMLKFPTTTVLLRRMLEKAKDLKYIDEKIVKNINGILLRASLWKTKARKILGGKKADEMKINSMVLEGNCIPITSRVKTVFKNHWSALQDPEKDKKSAKRLSSSLISFDVANSSDEEGSKELADPEKYKYVYPFFPDDINANIAEDPKVSWPLAMIKPSASAALDRAVTSSSSTYVSK